jgi:C1A family cysteine protease
MKLILALTFVAALGSMLYVNQTSSQTVLQDASAESLFEDFVMTYRKSYASISEFQSRFNTFKANLDLVKKIQAEQDTATFGVTQFMDMSQHEFKETMTGLDAHMAMVNSGKNNIATHRQPLKDDDVVDFRNNMRGVKNQGSCGSCWAFAAIAALEGTIAAEKGWTGNDVPNLSEQQLVDCDSQSDGCDGGWMYWAYDYLKNKNICTEDEYPYTGVDGVCKDTACSAKIYELKGYKNLNKAKCNELDDSIHHQPTAVAVDATPMQFYKNGIMKPSFLCSPDSLNHGVTLVAYNKAEGSYTIRNSWGATWGEAGHCRMQIGNTCGICEVATYPIVQFK